MAPAAIKRRDSEEDLIISMINSMSSLDLRNALKSHGENPGPITDSTRELWRSRLQKFMFQKSVKPSPRKRLPLNKSPPLPQKKPIVDIQGPQNKPIGKSPPLSQKKPIVDLQGPQNKPEKKVQLSQAVVSLVPDPTVSKKIEVAFNSHFPTVGSKRFFNYLLIDPRGLKGKEVNLEQFKKAIFYVGKGTGNRHFDHLMEARKWDQLKNTKCPDLKLKAILDIWDDDYGVVPVCFHHHSTQTYSLAREAIMIEELKLANLTNKCNGHMTLVEDHFGLRDRKILAWTFLTNALKVFDLQDAQIKRADVEIK